MFRMLPRHTSVNVLRPSRYISRMATTPFSSQAPTSHNATASNDNEGNTFSIKPSEGESEAQLTASAKALVEGKGWTLTNDGKALERGFKFKTFKAAWDFMNKVASECKSQKHHPEWSNVYNKTQIRWTTHRPEGLSSKDVHMADFCDSAAEEHGEIIEGEGGK